MRLNKMYNNLGAYIVHNVRAFEEINFYDSSQRLL